MGRDKATLTVGGVTLLDHAIRELRRISDDVIVVGRPAHLEAVRSLPDEVPRSGPVSGLITGLRAAHAPLCVVVACDYPFLEARVLRALTGISPGFDAVVPRIRGVPQPLHAVYQRAILAVAEAYFSDGRRSMRGLLKRLNVRWVSHEELARLDPSGQSTLNVNTPADWEEALGAAGRHIDR